MPAKPKIMVPMVMIVGFLFFLSSTAQSQNLIQVRSGHPRIWITPSTLPTLKTRAVGSHNDTYVALKAWCDTNWSLTRPSVPWSGDHFYDHALLRYAMIYLLGEISGSSYIVHSINDYRDKTIAILLDIASGGKEINHLMFVAVAYDWISAASPKDGSYWTNTTQKTKIVNWMKSFSYCGDTPFFESLAAYKLPETPCALYPGLAFYGDGINDALAQTYVTSVTSPTADYLTSMKSSAHMAGGSGGFGSGPCYGMMWEPGAMPGRTNPYDFYALYTATDMGLSGTFLTYPFSYGYYQWFIYNKQVGPLSTGGGSGATGTFIKHGDCGNWMWNGPYNWDYGIAQLFFLMATVHNLNSDTSTAQFLTWYAKVVMGITKVDGTLDLIFNDRTTLASSPDTLGIPKSKALGWNTSTGTIDSYPPRAKAGMGEVIMRSSWSFDASTTQASFYAFPYYYFGHQHFDSLAFSIFKGEPLALTTAGKYYYNYEGGEPDTRGSGFPHHWHYYDRLSSNTLLILDPTEQIIDWYGSLPPYHTFKDGGQRTAKETGLRWGDVVDGVVSGKEIRDWGGLIKFEDGTNYTYTSADATKGYNSTVGGVNYVSYRASPKTTLVQRDFVYSKSSDGKSDYFIVFDRVNSINPAHKKVFLLHTVGEPAMYNGGSPATTSVVHGKSDKTAGILSSTNTDNYIIKKATGAAGQLFMKTLLPTSTTVYKSGGSVTTTTTQSINDKDGATVGGAKITVGVTSTAEFSTAPVVTIDYEAFMCESKTASQLVNCIRGPRYFKNNPAVAHNSGATVTQVYTWVNREVDTNNWISYPHDYGKIHSDGMVLKDADEFGRWSLRIESGGTENNTNFLHVLFPTTNLSQVMPETILINSTSGNMKGALIKDPVNPRIVMFSPTTAQISDVTYDAKYLSSQTAKHLMTGLVPSAGYDIYRNGSKVTSSTASSQGIIYFESTGGATFRLVQTSGPIRRTSDTTPPSTPTNLSAGAVSSSQINLSWTASNDNVGVTGYRIYRNGSQIATSTDNFNGLDTPFIVPILIS